MSGSDAITLFEEARPTLVGLAYRILASRADAEDAVQDTFLKWQNADRDKIDNARSWLTSVCTRRCIDMLRAAHRSRVDYVGAWLPEPIHTTTGGDSDMTLASSVKTAFLMVLERLTPKERAAYLLHDIFDMSYGDIAATLAVQESACRKLVSRARANIEQAKVRHVTPVDRQEELLAAFQAAVADGAPARLAALLSDEVELHADGGGRVPTIQQVLHGRREVLDFIAEALRGYWQAYEWSRTDINGARGLMLRHEGTLVASVSFAYDENSRTVGIYIMRNPDKLAALRAPAIA